MAKKRPPSYYRYKKKHPPITVTLTKELKEALDEYRGDLSYGEAVKKLLTLTLDPYQKGYNTGYQEAYDKGYLAGIYKCIDACVKKFASKWDEKKIKDLKIELLALSWLK